MKKQLLLSATAASLFLGLALRSGAAPTLGGMSSASIGGKPLNVLAMTTKSASLVAPPTAKFAVSQMMPPAPVNYVPPTTAKKMAKMAVVAPGTGTGPQGKTSLIKTPVMPEPAGAMAITPQAQNLEIAGQRPDFYYHAPRLEFTPQTTHTTGQNGMGVGPGLPPGTSRYVPLGEF
jgi:hypothetical protein